MILFTDGYEADSPIPSMSRATSSSVKLRTKPVLNVSANHIATPIASSQFTLNRSTAQPDKIWQNAYVQKKDDSNTPSCDADSCRSSFNNGAAIDRLPRST